LDNSQILEPYSRLRIITIEDCIGKVSGDLANKRGRVLSMNHLDDKEIELLCEAPMRELKGYVDHLRSITSGNVRMNYEFSHYEKIPKNLEKVMTTE